VSVRFSAPLSEREEEEEEAEEEEDEKWIDKPTAVFLVTENPGERGCRSCDDFACG
jgi:hypothetical protein